MLQDVAKRIQPSSDSESRLTSSVCDHNNRTDRQTSQALVTLSIIKVVIDLRI